MATFSSHILEQTVAEFTRLPGIGKRSALRLVLHLLKAPPEESERLGQALIRLRKEIRYCRVCRNISEKEVCEICSNPKRDEKLLCVVEDIRDVIAIENTNQFNGKYHVLGGIISPMDGIGPKDLNIESLVERIQTTEVEELMMALSTTMEGDTTSFFIYRKLQQLGRPELKFTTIARGVSIGDELEYADEITLGRSIINRVPYENTHARG